MYASVLGISQFPKAVAADTDVRGNDGDFSGAGCTFFNDKSLVFLDAKGGHPDVGDMGEREPVCFDRLDKKIELDRFTLDFDIDTVDQLKNKLGAAAIILGAVQGDKVSLVAGVTKAETARIKAGQLVNHVATQVGGKGGGRPDLAQAGGSQPENLDAALASVAEWVAGEIGASEPA